MRIGAAILAMVWAGSALASSTPPGFRRIEAQLIQEDDPDAPPDAAAERGPTITRQREAERRFVKGELTHLGSDRLIVVDDRFGLRSGYAHLDGSSYLALTPEIDLYWGDSMALGLGVPLHVRAYSNGFVDHNGIHFRGADYAQLSDYARVLRFLTVGSKEEPLYLGISQLFATSIGHGAIVRRYYGSADRNVTRVGAELDVEAQYGGFEAFVGDIVHPSRFLAGSAYLKPLAFLPNPTWSQTSLALSTAVDFEAPYTLRRDPSGRPIPLDSGEPDLAETRRAQIVGLTLETKVVRTEHVDLKPYLDYSRLLTVSQPTGPGAQGKGGAGFTLGLLGRFNAGGERVHAFRLVGEARFFDGNYLPGYFDTLYEVQKFQYVTSRPDVAYEPKLRTVLMRDPAHKRAGYMLEASWQYDGGFAVLAAFEDSFHVAGPDDPCPSCAPAAKAFGRRNLTLHLESPTYGWIQFLATMYRRSYDGVVFDTGRPLGDNTLLYASLRMELLPILFLNARVYRSWQPDPVLGEVKNSWGGDIDLEFGWQFETTRPRR